MKRILVGFLAVLLAAAAFVALRHRATREARERRAEASLLRFDDRRVTALELDRGDATWRFEAGPDGWRVVSPVQDTADGERIRELMSRMRRSTVVRTIARPDALGSYGLAPPRAAIRLEGVTAPAFLVGDVVPTNDGVFAHVGDREGVLVIEATPGTLLFDPDPARLRDHALIDTGGEPPAALEVARGAGAVGLRREADGWWMTSPRRLPASDRAVERLLTALGRTEVRRFLDGVDAADPTFGLDGSNGRVVLHGGTERTVVLGAETTRGERYARRSDRPPVLAVDPGPLRDLPWAVDDLLDTRLTKLNRYRVTRFSYRDSAGTTLEAARDGERWTTADGASPSPDAVYAFLVRVLEAPVVGWTELAGSPGTPRASLELEVEGGSVERVAFLGGRSAVLDSLPGVALRLSSDPPPAALP